MLQFLQDLGESALDWAAGIDWTTAGAGVAAACGLGLIRRLARRTAAGEELPPEEALTRAILEVVPAADKVWSAGRNYYLSDSRLKVDWDSSPAIRFHGGSALAELSRRQCRRIFKAVRREALKREAAAAKAKRNADRSALGLPPV